MEGGNPFWARSPGFLERAPISFASVRLMKRDPFCLKSRENGAKGFPLVKKYNGKSRRKTSRRLFSYAVSTVALPGVTGANVEGVMILHFTARRTFQFAVESGFSRRTELEADSVGEPRAAEVRIEVLMQSAFGGFAVGVAQEVVVDRGLRVETARIAFELPTGARRVGRSASGSRPVRS